MHNQKHTPSVNNKRDRLSYLWLAVAQRLLRLDPLQEAIYRRLMRLHAARGDRGAVSRTFQSCAAVLKRELAIDPGLTTRATYERLILNLS